jgi:hypothetical protein
LRLPQNLQRVGKPLDVADGRCANLRNGIVLRKVSAVVRWKALLANELSSTLAFANRPDRCEFAKSSIQVEILAKNDQLLY